MYTTHDHQTPNGKWVQHYHLVDEFEAEDPHDHLWREFSEPENFDHPFANPKPRFSAGSYAILHADYVKMARKFTLETLDRLNSRRAHWIATTSVNKRAIANALSEVMREKEIEENNDG